MSKKTLLLLTLPLALTSCSVYTNTSFSEYRGASTLRGSGGTVKQVDGIDVWTTGAPNHRYKVLGLIQQTHTNDNTVLSVMAGMTASSNITKLAKEKGGDAIIYVTNQSRVTGSSGDGMTFVNQYGGYGSTHTHVHSFANSQNNTETQKQAAVIKYLK